MAWGPAFAGMTVKGVVGLIAWVPAFAGMTVKELMA